MKKCRLHGAIAAIAPTVVFVFEREREKNKRDEATRLSKRILAKQ
jgi:hypothetical protein